jgi:hypothetical protein
LVLIAEAIKAASIIQKAYKTYHGKKPTITIRNYIHDDKADKPEYVIPYGRKDFFSHVMSKVQAFVPGAIQTTVLILKGKRIDLYRTVREYEDLFPDAVIELRMKPPLGGGGKRAASAMTSRTNKQDKIEALKTNIKVHEVQMDKDVLNSTPVAIQESLDQLAEMVKPGWSISTALKKLDNPTLKILSETVNSGSTTELNITSLTASLVLPALAKLKNCMKQVNVLKNLMEGVFLAHYADKFFEGGTFNNGNFRTAAATILDSRNE